MDAIGTPLVVFVLFLLVPANFVCIALLGRREKRFGPYRPLGLERLTIMTASMSLIAVLIGLALVGHSIRDESTMRVFVASAILGTLALVGTGLCLRKGRRVGTHAEAVPGWHLGPAIVVVALLVLAYFLLRRVV